MSTSDTQHHPKRMLSSGFTLAVIIGGIIGLGILRTPGEVAAVVPDPLKFVFVWVFGGLFVLLSTAVVAELVGMTSRSGGSYVLERRAYGPFPGFGIALFQAVAEIDAAAYAAIMVALSWPVHGFLVRSGSKRNGTKQAS